MKEIPFFLPTSNGAMAAVASLPDDEIRGPAVMLIPGGANGRSRVRVLRDVAADLAGEGVAALRFDYPGAGLSPGARMSWKNAELSDCVVEAGDWFLQKTGSDGLAIAGTCIGGLVALRVAAAYEKVKKVTIVGVPLRRGRRRTTKPRIRAGIAGLEKIGPAVAPKLAKRSRSWDAGEEWHSDLLDHLTAIAPRADVEFVYGENDRIYQDYVMLKSTDELPEEVRAPLHASVLEGGSLGGLLDVEQHPWVRSTLTKSFLDPVSVDV